MVDFEASGENVFEVDSNLSYFGEGIENPKDENKHISEKGFYLKK